MNPYRRIEPGRHRALETRLWDLIQDLGGHATRLLLYCWIGPHSTPFGILDVPEAYVLHDLLWKCPRVRRAWAVLEKADLAWRDGNLIFIVPFLMANPPANENVLKGWRKQISQLPESRFFKILHDRASIWLKPEGLSWLSARIPSDSALQSSANVEPTRKQFQDSSETVLKLSVQGSENREQGVQGEEPDGALRSASPREAASLRAPGAAIGTLLGTFSGDRKLTRTFALKAGYSESEIAEALGEESEPTVEVDRDQACEVTTGAGT